MKVRNLVAVMLAVLVMPFSAQASCIGSSCIINLDPDFSDAGTYWTENGNVTYGNITTCSGTSARVRLDPGESISQTFTPGSNFDYNLLLDAFLINDTDNFYDQLTITVRNNSTSVSEVFYLRGSSWTNCSSSFSQDFANDYDNVSVTVTLEVQSLSTSGWYLDNIAFWGIN